MKINFNPARKINVLIIIALCNCFLAFQACDDYPDPSLVTIEGMVVNEETDEGIASAEVEMLNFSTNTDITGKFSLLIPEEVIPDTSFMITTKASGFVNGMNYANKQTLSALPFISLIPTREPVSIGPEGGNVIIPEVTESLNPDDHIQLIIPENALTETEDISVTPLQGNYVPGRSSMQSLGLLNMATVNLEPSGLHLEKDAQLEFPLPFQSDQGEVIPLLLFNNQTMQWEDTGDSAVVDQSGTKATAEISHFSTYSIGIEGNFTREQIIYNQRIDIVSYGAKACFQDSLVYPEGIPEGINQNWLTNTISLNLFNPTAPNFINPKCVWLIKPNPYDYDRDIPQGYSSPCPEVIQQPCNDCIPKIVYLEAVDFIIESVQFNYKKRGASLTEYIEYLAMVVKIVPCLVGWDCDCHEGGSGE